jgi:lysophospholipase L1-like esterase
LRTATARRIAAALLVTALGCAPRGPALTAVGVAALPRPGRDPLALPAPPPPPADPLTHEGTAPLPRHDPHGDDPTAPPAPVPAVPAVEPSSSQNPAPEAPRWDDPSGRCADFLAAARAGRVPLRIVQLGDSHTEGDAWTGALRRALMRARGDGGRGFVPVVGGQSDLVRTLQGPWRVVRRGLGPMDGPGGLGLSRAIASAPASVFRVGTCAGCGVGERATAVTVFYRAQPTGGSLRVQVDDTAPRTVSTRQGESVNFAVSDGAHTVMLRPAGDGPVEVFGVVLDRAGDGARVEGAGIVGAQAVHFATHDDPSLVAQLAQRAPTLVLLAFGTNESVAARRDPAEYAAALRTLIARVRAAVPGVMVGLVGPPDTALRSRLPGGGYIPAPRLEAIVETGREVARSEATLFFDARAAMGGPGSVDAWATARPALAEPDHVHLTRLGYRRLAAMMAEALVGAAPP